MSEDDELESWWDDSWMSPEELHELREGQIMLDNLSDEVRLLSEDARWGLLEEAIRAERLVAMQHAFARGRRDCLQSLVCPEVGVRDWKKALNPKVPMAKRMHDLRLSASTHVRNRPWEDAANDDQE